LEKEIAELKSQLKRQASPANDINHHGNNGNHLAHRESPTSPTPSQLYHQPYSQEADDIAAKFEELLRNDSSILNYLPENMTRLSKGTYQWGTRKIQLEIINKELVVKVGSGFQKFKDWMKSHAAPTDELNDLSEMAKGINDTFLLADNGGHNGFKYV